MKSLRTFAISSLVAFGVVSNAQAAPVQIDFNVAGFAGPLTGTVQTFTKTGVDLGAGGTVDLTFDALNAAQLSSRLLHWDADDGNGFGFGDGFGIRREAQVPISADSYAQDEIEGDEILRLSFSTPVNLLGFNVTDMFRERELGPFGESPLTGCFVNGPDCYNEEGSYSVDGGATWVTFFADPTQFRVLANFGVTNGVQDIAVNALNVSSVLFRAPGRTGTIAEGNFRLNEYSLAGIRLDQQFDAPVPEPASLVLMGSGLLGIVGVIRRRKTQQSNASAPEVL